MMKQYREAHETGGGYFASFSLGGFLRNVRRRRGSGASLLGITLTKRHEMPMAGIPFHAAEGYLTKLLALGHKVAICDQLEPPKTGKLVKRGITAFLHQERFWRIDNLDAVSNHFLMAFDLDPKEMRASWLDLSTEVRSFHL